ncbi:MAG: VCBS repeat-containing protein [Planctomycetes bacterium]|nr:VCBS repeat-containing protein [Planctomycetota bacterium]
MRLTWIALSVVSLAFLPGRAAAQVDAADLPDAPGASTLHEKYGFSGMIISKINGDAAMLTAADLDGDGCSELAIVNNDRAKIELFFKAVEGGDLGDVEAPDPERVNELADEVFFRRKAHATEEKVTSLAVADIDGDGRGDLIYTGDSGKLTIAFQDAEQRFSRELRLDVEGCSTSWHALRPADLDGDGRKDLAVLGRDATYFFLQADDGRFPERQKLANATRDAGSFQVLDLNGDSHQDLLYVAYSSEWPFRCRLGEPGLAFGPEIRSRFAEIRSYAIGNVDADPQVEIVAVRRKSGRLALLSFGQAAAPSAEELALSSLRSVPFEELKDADKREALLADLDGDTRPELLVAEPSAARIVVHRSLLGGGGSSARSFPSFVGASHPRLADLDKDGALELVVAAPDEGAIGVAEIDAGGRIGFPAARAVPGGEDLLALDAADTDGDGAAEIWLALGTGPANSKRQRRVVRLDGAGAVAAEVKLGTLASDPNDMLLVDLDRDGRRDVMIFVPKAVPVILRADAAGGFTDMEAAKAPGLGILKDVTRPALACGDVDGDGQAELLVPGPNFVRALYLGADGTPQVVAQFNLEDPAAQVARVGLGDLDGDGAPEVVVVERAASSLLVLAQAAGSHRQIGKVDLGGILPAGLLVADLDGNGAADVLALASDRFAVVQNGGADPAFTLAADLEAPIRDAFLEQLALGDVNADGEADAVLTESNQHLVTISAIHEDALEYALKFAVFEERIFERDGRGGREPREIVVSDVTGDGRADVAILVHDRLIVYPQE